MFGKGAGRLVSYSFSEGGSLGEVGLIFEGKRGKVMWYEEKMRNARQAKLGLSWRGWIDMAYGGKTTATIQNYRAAQRTAAAGAVDGTRAGRAQKR